jgi:hypothetical protein
LNEVGIPAIITKGVTEIWINRFRDNCLPEKIIAKIKKVSGINAAPSKVARAKNKETEGLPARLVNRFALNHRKPDTKKEVSALLTFFLGLLKKTPTASVIRIRPLIIKMVFCNIESLC